MSNDVEIIVRTRDDTNFGRIREKAKAEGGRAGKDGGEEFSKEFSKGTERASNDGNLLGRALFGLRSQLVSVVAAGARSAVMVANIGLTALSAAPAVIHAAQVVAGFAHAAIAASPALLGMAAAGGFVVLTLKQIEPAVKKALSPITDGFHKAGQAAGDLAAKGVKPLAAEFMKLAMPHIAAAMNVIGLATRDVVKGFLGWAKSTAGLQALKGIVDAAALSFARLAPHVQALAQSFLAMLGRIAGLSAHLGTSGLIGLLDNLRGRLDRVTAASVQGGIDRLASAFGKVRDAVKTVAQHVGEAVRFFEKYRQQISLISDVVAGLAIAFGGPVTASIAVVGILIRHIGLVKQAMSGLKSAFSSGGSMAGVSAVIREHVIPAFKELADWARTKLAPALLSAWHSIEAGFKDAGKSISKAFRDNRGELTELWNALKKAASWIITTFIPLFGKGLGQEIKAAGKVISGVIYIISGLVDAFNGVVSAIKAVGRAWGAVKDFFKAHKATFVAITAAAFGSVGLLLREAARWVRNHVGKLTAVAGAAFSAIASVLSHVKAWVTSHLGRLTGSASGALSAIATVLSRVRGWVRSHLGRLTGAPGAALSAIATVLARVRGWVKTHVGTFSAAIGGALGEISRLLGAASRWAGKVFTATFDVVKHLIPGMATGGISHAAEGGPRGNLTMVGERGRELVRLPFGSTVIPNGQTEGMLAAAGNAGGRLTLEIRSGGSRFDDLLVEVIRKAVRVNGGNVQTVLGR